MSAEANTSTGTLSWLAPILSDSTLDPTETLLMIGLADHVDANDECFVGIQTLATYARVSYATAKRRLAALEEAGRLQRTRRRRDDGNLSTYVWHLIRDAPGLNMSRDHGSPGCALTMAHPGEPAEVPSVEVPSVEEELLTHARPSLVDDFEASRRYQHPRSEFDDFWDVFPSPKEKIATRAAWARALKKTTPAKIIAGALAYANDPNRDPEYTKNPVTWLDKGCWDDEPTAAPVRVSKSTRALAVWANSQP